MLARKRSLVSCSAEVAVVQHVLVPGRGEDGRHRGLADLAARAAAVPGEERRRTSGARAAGRGGTAPGGSAGSARRGGWRPSTPARFSSPGRAARRAAARTSRSRCRRLVQALTPPTEVRSWPRMASQMAPLATLWQVQMVRRVGQRVDAEAGAAAPSLRGRMSSSGCGGSGGLALGEREQLRVARGVADQHAAEEALAVRAEDELLVDAGDRVGEGDDPGAGLGGEGVAEARHVDAQELELGAHVEAAEAGRRRRSAVATAMRGHLVARAPTRP